MMSLPVRLVLAMALFAGVAACSKVQAHTPDASPPLATPDPPLRVVMPPPPFEEPPATPPDAPPASTQPARRAEPPTTRPVSGTTTAPPPATVPPPAPEPTPLQTTPNAANQEKQIVARLDAARRDLGKVDARTLSPDARAQYDWALQLAKNADAALKAKNYNYAEQLADKAARLASLLLKRAPTAPTSV